MPTDREVRAELVRLLAYSNARKVGDALGVSRATAARWARGETGRPSDLEAVRRLLNTAKEPQPEWAEALDVKVTATQVLVERIAEMLGASIAAGSSPIPPLSGGSEDGPAAARPTGRHGR